MKIFYIVDVMYPTYYPEEEEEDTWTKTAEVPEALWTSYKEAFNNFNKLHNELHEALTKSKYE